MLFMFAREGQTYCANSSADIRSVTLRFLIAAARSNPARMMKDERERPALREAATSVALIFGLG